MRMVIDGADQASPGVTKLRQQKLGDKAWFFVALIIPRSARRIRGGGDPREAGSSLIGICG